MSTSEPAARRRTPSSGMTAIELLVGISLTVLLAMGVAPLVLSLQAAGVREADRTVSVLQGRVAAARLERDLRMATAAGCPFSVAGPILEAGPDVVVLLGRTAGSGLSIIEWEISGGNLMRRWGPCPQTLPTVVSHGLYVDNKSMLLDLADGSRFAYVVSGEYFEGTVPRNDLPEVERVILKAGGSDDAGVWAQKIHLAGRVGR